MWDKLSAFSIVTTASSLLCPDTAIVFDELRKCSLDTSSCQPRNRRRRVSLSCMAKCQIDSDGPDGPCMDRCLALYVVVLLISPSSRVLGCPRCAVRSTLSYASPYRANLPSPAALADDL